VAPWQLIQKAQQGIKFLELNIVTQKNIAPLTMPDEARLAFLYDLSQDCVELVSPHEEIQRLNQELSRSKIIANDLIQENELLHVRIKNMMEHNSSKISDLKQQLQGKETELKNVRSQLSRHKRKNQGPKYFEKHFEATSAVHGPSGANSVAANNKPSQEQLMADIERLKWMHLRMKQEQAPKTKRTKQIMKNEIDEIENIVEDLSFSLHNQNPCGESSTTKRVLKDTEVRINGHSCQFTTNNNNIKNNQNIDSTAKINGIIEENNLNASIARFENGDEENQNLNEFQKRRLHLTNHFPSV